MSDIVVEDKIVTNINNLIDELESEGFDFVGKVNVELKKKSFMWTVCEWKIIPDFIRDRYTLDVLRLATLWSLAEDADLQKWARHSSQNGVLMSKYSLFKKFGNYTFFLEIAKGMREHFTEMINDIDNLELSSVEEDDEI